MYTRLVKLVPSSSLRQAFRLPGTPIRVTLRGKEHPFAGRRKKRR